jgi:hypothetical protein
MYVDEALIFKVTGALRAENLSVRNATLGLLGGMHFLVNIVYG